MLFAIARIGLLRLGIVLLSTALSFGEVAAGDVLADRARFLDAEHAFRTGNHERYQSLAATLTAYPLYPYLRYEELRSQLASADDKTVEAFMVNFRDSPLSSRLRTQWLRKLAAARRWQKFSDVYEPGRGTTFECQQLTALQNTGRTDEAFDSVETLWLHPRSQPSECDTTFAAWRAAGRLTPDLVWRRIGLAIDAGETGLADYLKRFLPTAQRSSVDLWISLRKQPHRVTEDSLFEKAGHRSRDIRVWAMLRLARTDVTQAELAWRRLESTAGFSNDTANQVKRQIGLSYAYRHDARALSWFKDLPESAADERVQEWRILSALRHSRWPLVLEYIERLPTDERADERWHYWWARAAEALGQAEQAKATYRQIAQQRNYYAFLAADKLMLAYRLNHQRLMFDEADIERLKQVPGVARARELHALERWVDARREWRVLLKTHKSDEQRGALAVIADAWGWHGRAIITVASTKYLNDLALRFPTPFTEHFQARAEEFALDPAWVFAVARQESAFMADARSPAGALGLMQIMPATGKDIATKLKATGFRTAKLLQPSLNVRFGTWYLRHLLNRIGDNPVLATAGYNAGPHRVDRWLPKKGELATDIWIETIPFRETRKYVRRILAYTVIYQFNLGRPSVRLSDRFTAVKSAGN